MLSLAQNNLTMQDYGLKKHHSFFHTHKQSSFFPFSPQFYVSVNYGTDIKLCCDVIIGTIPLRMAFSDPAPSYSQAVTVQPSAPPLAPPQAPPPPSTEPSAPLPYPDIREYCVGVLCH